MTRRSSKKKDDWTLKDFVNSVHRVMKRQEKKNPEIKALHARLAHPEKKTQIVALTGNFGTGKSTVAKIFADAGVPCIDADDIAHRLCAPESPAWEAIVEQWGEGILQPDQTIDRKKLGAIVFQHPEERRKLELILHPRIREQMQAETKKIAQQKKPLVVLEIPLLFEVGWHTEEKWDAIIVVSCHESQQRARLKEKLGLSDAEILAREQAQWPIEKKLRLATHTLDNSGTLDATRKQVQSILQQLKENGEED